MAEEIFADAYAIHTFKLYDKEHDLVLGDRLKHGCVQNLITMAFWELGKELECGSSPMIEWKRLFAGNQVTPDAPAYILQAADMIVYDNLTREERAVIDAEDIFIQDTLAREHFVYNEGRAEGVAIGAEERAALEAKSAEHEAQSANLKAQLDAVIRNLKAAGMDASDICKDTGLSAADVAAL
jgi:hypothetical protein